MAKDTSDLNVFKLTHREMEIVLALCSGNSTRAIARKLSMSPGRLKLCLTEVFIKLGAQDRLELVLIATYHGISPSDPVNHPVPKISLTSKQLSRKPHDSGSSQVAYHCASGNASTSPALSAVRDLKSLLFFSDPVSDHPDSHRGPGGHFS